MNEHPPVYIVMQDPHRDKDEDDHSPSLVSTMLRLAILGGIAYLGYKLYEEAQERKREQAAEEVRKWNEFKHNQKHGA